MIHVVGQRTAERLEAAEFVERLDLLRDGVGDLILREQLADGTVLPFGGGAVVAPDVKNDRVVALPMSVEAVNELADLGVGVLDEAGVEFHQAQSGRRARIPGCCPTPASSGRAA